MTLCSFSKVVSCKRPFHVSNSYINKTRWRCLFLRVRKNWRRDDRKISERWSQKKCICIMLYFSIKSMMIIRIKSVNFTMKIIFLQLVRLGYSLEVHVVEATSDKRPLKLIAAVCVIVAV